MIATSPSSSRLFCLFVSLCGCFQCCFLSYNVRKRWTTCETTRVEVQFSSLTDKGRFSRDSPPVFSAGAIVSSSGTGRDVHSLTSIQHFFCDHGFAHPPECHVRWFWRLSLRVACPNHATFPVSWQLPEEVPVDPQGSCFCFAPSRSGSNRGPSAYQPSALPLGHTSSLLEVWASAPLTAECTKLWLPHDKGLQSASALLSL